MYLIYNVYIKRLFQDDLCSCRSLYVKTMQEWRRMLSKRKKKDISVQMQDRLYWENM